MTAAVRSINGIKVPRILYGTAWKEESTQTLTELAIHRGFRGIDTANQRRHYYEAAVGNAVAAAIQQGLARREDLFLQTKFTFRSGQDQRLPYAADAAVSDQVKQSALSSLEHLQTDHIDSYILHGPSSRGSLKSDDWDAWKAMEELYEAGTVRILGVSNVTSGQLLELYEGARVRPRFVQNRCYATQLWDRDVRRFCAENDIVYQGFSLLTANPAVLKSGLIHDLAAGMKKTPAQIVFRFAMEVGMLPLTGTTNPQHMDEDLGAMDFELVPDVVEKIEKLGVS